MKKLIVILLIGLLAVCFADANSPSVNPKNEKKILLGIIIDTSPCSGKTWNLLQASILELAYHLRADDQVVIFTAHPGKPKLRLTERIGPEGEFDPSDIVRQTSSFSREFLFDADIGRAIEAAFEHFRRKSKGYQCCLVVLSKGKASDSQVKQIKRLAVAFKARGWPLRFVCERRRANRWLLVAGNNQQLDLRLLEKPELALWLDAARKPTPGEQRSAPDLLKPPVQAVKDAKSTQRPTTSEIGGAEKQPVKVEITSMPKLSQDFVGSIDQDRGISPMSGKKSPELKSPKVLSKQGRASKKSKKALLVALIVLASLVGIGTLGYLIKKNLWPSKLRSQIEDLTGDHPEDLQQRLISFVNGERQDLGDIDTLGEIVIGREVGSSVFIDSEDVEQRHARIFKSGGKLRIQNLAAFPILVDGEQLNRKKKADLILPVDLKLAEDVYLSLVSEAVNPVENEGENYENENI